MYILDMPSVFVHCTKTLSMYIKKKTNGAIPKRGRNPTGKRNPIGKKILKCCSRESPKNEPNGANTQQI